MLGTDSNSFAVARYLSEEPAPLLTLRRVRLTSMGYESGNPHRYWGVGAPLYRAETTDGEITLHVRATTRAEAKRLITEQITSQRFWMRDEAIARFKGARFTR